MEANARKRIKKSVRRKKWQIRETVWTTLRHWRTNGERKICANTIVRLLACGDSSEHTKNVDAVIPVKRKMSVPCFTLHHCHTPTPDTHTHASTTTSSTMMANTLKRHTFDSFRLLFMRAALIRRVCPFADACLFVNGYISSINNPLMVCLFNAWRLKITTYMLRCFVSKPTHTHTNTLFLLPHLLFAFLFRSFALATSVERSFERTANKSKSSSALWFVLIVFCFVSRHRSRSHTSTALFSTFVCSTQAHRLFGFRLLLSLWRRRTLDTHF